MVKLNTIEQSTLNKETSVIKKIASDEAFYNVRSIVNFLKENKLSLGYTKGATASLFTNYTNGLAHINPLEYGLLYDRNYLQKHHDGYKVPNHYKPYFGILLNKESYQKTKSYLKANKYTDAVLEFHNIDIIYDKRLDNIKIHKKYSFQELSKLAIKKNNSDSVFQIKDFNDYIDVHSFNKTEGLQDYWFQELARNSYISLANKYSFLQTNNLFNIILFQEEWMRIMKKITGLSYLNINMFRLALGRKIKLKEFEKILEDKLKIKYKLSGNEFKQINETLLNCIYYLPCKANIVSDAYIDLVSGKNEKI